MSVKAIVPGALVVLGVLFMGILPSAQAADPVVILKPMEDADLPAGSQISEERLEETKEKVRELKANLKAQQLREQQQQQQQQESQPEGEQQ